MSQGKKLRHREVNKISQMVCVIGRTGIQIPVERTPKLKFLPQGHTALREGRMATKETSEASA